MDLTGCSVMGGGHDWFGSDNCGTGADGGLRDRRCEQRHAIKNTDAA